MTTVAFDTHKAAKTLATAGFTNEQVDANIEVLMEVTDGLATKKDLNALETSLNAKIDTFEQRLTAKMWAMQFSAIVLLLAGGLALLQFVLPGMITEAVVTAITPAS